MTDPKRYRKWVMVSFLITMLAVILVALSYTIDTPDLRKGMAVGGFSLAIASMILRWIAKLKPEWLNGRSSNQNNS